MTMWRTLSLNRKLAIGAIALGALAVFAEPYAGPAVSIAPRDLAVMVQREVDHVTPRELADWIVAGRADFRVVDVRSADQYAAYHIPGAENLSVAALPDQRFEPTEKVVLYSDEGTHAAQAWFLLRARGARNAYILLNGLSGWKEEVLFPALEPASTPFQRQRNDQLARVAAHFGGRAVDPGGASPGATPAAVPMPVMTMPAAPAAATATAGTTPRKKKEGC